MNDIRTRREERLSALTHSIGTLAGLAATILLLVVAVRRTDAWLVAGVSVFGASLVLLYTVSSLYHWATSQVAKRRLRKLDHAAIYVLIAGTYTPFTLGPLRGGWGWTLFGIVWGLALAGVAFKLFFTGRVPRVSTAIYAALGWLVIVAIVPVVRTLAGVTLVWLVAGGLAYTAGIAFYASRRMPYAHAVWHLFVMGGSACHVVAVASLLPIATLQ